MSFVTKSITVDEEVWEEVKRNLQGYKGMSELIRENLRKWADMAEMTDNEEIRAKIKELEEAKKLEEEKLRSNELEKTNIEKQIKTLKGKLEKNEARTDQENNENVQYAIEKVKDDPTLAEGQSRRLYNKHGININPQKLTELAGVENG